MSLAAVVFDSYLMICFETDAKEGEIASGDVRCR